MVQPSPLGVKILATHSKHLEVFKVLPLLSTHSTSNQKCTTTECDKAAKVELIWYFLLAPQVE